MGDTNLFHAKIKSDIQKKNAPMLTNNAALVLHAGSKIVDIAV
jgi:hypothetical protein